MTWLGMGDQRDAEGNLTDLALALDAMSDVGCDCGTDEDGSCVGCLCEQALKGLYEQLESARAEVERLKAHTREQERAAVVAKDPSIDESAVLRELSNIIHGEPLWPGDTLSHATANACVHRGWALRNSDGCFVPTDAGRRRSRMKASIERGEHWPEKEKRDEVNR